MYYPSRAGFLEKKNRFLEALASPRLRLAPTWLSARKVHAPRPTDPLHSDVPALRQAELEAIYHGQRVAGDFYEFLRVGPSRVLFGLFDIAGRREDTRNILISAQRTFRTLAPQLFAPDHFNEPEAMVELCCAINRTILQSAAGVRSCPAFIGCYHEDLGTVCYANAGHTPALLRDASGIATLEATGLPLGLFSHVTQSAFTCALVPGALLMVVSRGIVEAEAKGEEFGLDGVRQVLQQTSTRTASDMCLAVLSEARCFMRASPTHNDITALALLRAPNSQPGSGSPGTLLH
jgi:serine phosphatase RsbU (regulator of sigma subunit)